MNKYYRFSAFLLIVLLGITMIPGKSVDIESRNNMTKQQMASIIEKFKNYQIVDTAKLDDGTTIIERSHNQKQSSLFVTTMPDNKVRYEYYDRVLEKIFWCEKDNQLESSSDKINVFDVKDARKKSA